jgi:hypothetical protein
LFIPDGDLHSFLISERSFFEYENLSIVTFERDSKLSTIGKHAFVSSPVLKWIWLPPLLSYVSAMSLIGFDIENSLPQGGAQFLRVRGDFLETSDGRSAVLEGYLGCFQGD